jgi:hypothetical protein
MLGASKLAFYLGAVAVFFVPDPIRAQTIRDLTTACSANVQGLTTSGSDSTPNCDSQVEALEDVGKQLDMGFAGTTIDTTSTPAIDAIAKDSGYGYAIATAELTYYMTVMPSPSLPSIISTIPIDVSGHYRLSFDGSNEGNIIQLAVKPLPSLYAAVFYVDPLDYTASFALNQSSSFSGPTIPALYLFPTVYQISMSATAFASEGYAYAFVDPYFYVDPSFEYADDVTLLFSTGINNESLESSIPEPSTWAMMLLGFAGLGFVGYRASRRAAAAAA